MNMSELDKQKTHIEDLPTHDVAKRIDKIAFNGYRKFFEKWNKGDLVNYAAARAARDSIIEEIRRALP